MSVLTRSDAKRALGWLTWLSAFLVAAQYAYGIVDLLRNQSAMAVSLFDYGRSFVYLAWIAPLLCVFPFGTGFCSDWSSGFAAPQILRVGESKYIRSKLLAAGISGGTVWCAGAFLFFLICLARVPLEGPAEYFPYAPNLADAMAIGGPALFMASSLYLYILGGAYYALSSLALSAWWPNPYAAIAFPLLLSQTSSLIVGRLDLPYCLNLGMLIDGASALYLGPTLGLGTLILGSVIALCCVIFSLGVKRRMRNG